MLTFIVGVCAGVFADRLYPVPVTAAINGVKSAWAKLTTKSTP